ncbi:MAG: patatin-like phospholipase family protein [Flavobacteriaceae bacterium]
MQSTTTQDLFLWVCKILICFATPSVLLFAFGCAKQRNPVPVGKFYMAEIPDIPGVRAFGGSYSEVFQKDMEESLTQEPAKLFVDNESGGKIYKFLALSSGGPNGAFGAGFLAGWTAHGTRPNFKVVTGISTGAIIAPFAFIGPEYDPQLEELFTSTSTKSLIRHKGFRVFNNPESLADSTPMLTTMRELADEHFLKRIAEEHNKGKRLLIGTTHLDAGHLVVWNMGIIANSKSPNALELFHKVILASASIPGVFPPVYIDVKVGKEDFDEMHLDGAIKAQFFLAEALIDLAKAEAKFGSQLQKAKKEFYIIRNGKLSPEPAQVERRLVPILTRAMAGMTQTAVRDSLYRVYVFAQNAEADFNYIGVPNNYNLRQSQEFANESEMINLFNEGFSTAVRGPEWIKNPQTLGF